MHNKIPGNLLKWTKSQIGKLNVVYQDFDIVGNIASVIEIFNLVAGMKNIKVNFPVYGKIEVHADMDMMKTILRNLLSNAITSPIWKPARNSWRKTARRKAW